MINFKTGVHTIEFQTNKYLKLSDLPPAYDDAIKPEGKKRYRLNITKLPGMQEYNSLDDHNGTYADNLSLMTVLVNLIAYRGGIYDRRVFYTDGNGTITSVRCMPDDKDEITRYGAEYYDKPKQAKTDEYGNARLELRRLNLSNESVPFIVKEWRDLLQSITKKEYLSMLEAHARSLHSIREDGETAAKFVKRVRCMLIGYEEWHKLCKLNVLHTKDYDKLPPLPKWAEVKTFIDEITAQLDEALSQPQEITFHPDSVTNEVPF